MGKDLKYIAKHVTEWPSDDEHHVRLDADGEICFTSETRSTGVQHDFYPGKPGANWLEETIIRAFSNYTHPCFVMGEDQGIGRMHSREEWARTRGELE